MAIEARETGLYEAAWNQFVIELRDYASDVLEWLQDLSIGEQLLGLAAFVMVLMFLIVSKARKSDDPGGNGRQFTGAMLLVIIIAFGVGWSVDPGAGSLSHIFAR